MTTLQIWLTIIYGCVGILYGLFSMVDQRLNRSKNSEWYMLLLIFLNGLILWPLNVIFRSFRRKPQF